MGSMVTPAGAPRAWRRIWEEWHRRLPLPCGQCGEPVSPGEPWSLGHRMPRAAGGGDEAGNLWPEHAAAATCPGRAWAGCGPLSGPAGADAAAVAGVVMPGRHRGSAALRVAGRAAELADSGPLTGVAGSRLSGFRALADDPVRAIPFLRGRVSGNEADDPHDRQSDETDDEKQRDPRQDPHQDDDSPRDFPGVHGAEAWLLRVVWLRQVQRLAIARVGFVGLCHVSQTREDAGGVTRRDGGRAGAGCPVLAGNGTRPAHLR